MTTDPPAIQPPLGQVVRYCPATRAAALIGDAWTQLILREAFAGTRRYSDFLSRLGISRAVLADRLRRLARNGVIASSPPSHGGARVEYVLTEMGRDAIGIILIQDAWDLEFGASGVGSRVTTYRHEAHGRSLAPVVLDGRHGSPIEMRRLNYLLGVLGDGIEAAPNGRHKLVGETILPGIMPGSISLLGDHWSWMILISAFFHVRRFDEFSQTLGIASNVLADRLQRLVAADLLVRERYMRAPPRHEYRLAVAGRAMHPLFCALYAWGERWVCPADAPPMVLVDMLTGRRVRPLVCDAATGTPVDARELQPVRADVAA